MRGNEEKIREIVDEDNLEEFPIPMRGNETSRTRRCPWVGASFQSP